MSPTAFDTETELIAPGNQAPHLICLTWTTLPGQAQIIHWRQAQEIARELILNATAESPLVGHNAAFDLCVLGRQFPDLVPHIFEAYQCGAILDTAVAEKLIDIAYGIDRSAEKRPYALASLADRYLGLHLDKDTWRLRYGELKEVCLHEWPQGARDYALTDAKTTLEIFKLQQKHALPDLAAQCRADFALRLASNRGFITDFKSVDRFKKQISTEFEVTQALLFKNGLLKRQKRKGEVVAVRESKKAQERLSQILGYKAARTPRGQIQVNEESCTASKDETLIAYNRYTKLQTLMSKDVEILERGTREPVHTYFNVLVNTGRTSSSGPNMQNPRREPGVRECFVPREGFVFASADYEAAELHTLAQVCVHFFGYSVLANQLNQGIDPHLSFAAKLLHVDYAEAVTRKKDGDEKIAETRQMAKAANFGFPGGMGPNAFQAYAKGYGFDLELNDAKMLKRQWLNSFPEMNRYFRHVSALCTSGVGTVNHLFTRRRRGKVHYTAACNSYFQGLAADGAKRALFEVQRQCQANKNSALFGSHVVNFLHDEIMLEVPEAQGHEAARELANIMVREFNHFVPDVPVRASPQLMRCWSKNAKPVFNAAGRLVPWELKEDSPV